MRTPFQHQSLSWSENTSTSYLPSTWHLWSTQTMFHYTTPAFSLTTQYVASTYLCLRSVYIARSTDSCCIKDSKTGCDKGQGDWEKTFSGSTFSQTYITMFRSPAVRAWEVMLQHACKYYETLKFKRGTVNAIIRPSSGWGWNLNWKQIQFFNTLLQGHLW